MVVMGAALLVVVEEVVVPTWKDQPGLVLSAQTFVRVTINSRSHVEREGCGVGVEEGGGHDSGQRSAIFGRGVT